MSAGDHYWVVGRHGWGSPEYAAVARGTRVMVWTPYEADALKFWVKAEAERLAAAVTGGFTDECKATPDDRFEKWMKEYHG